MLTTTSQQYPGKSDGLDPKWSLCSLTIVRTLLPLAQIEGFKDVAKVKCSACKEELVIDRNKRKAETEAKQLV